jgi:hypothetical protein
MKITMWVSWVVKFPISRHPNALQVMKRTSRFSAFHDLIQLIPRWMADVSRVFYGFTCVQIIPSLIHIKQPHWFNVFFIDPLTSIIISMWLSGCLLWTREGIIIYFHHVEKPHLGYFGMMVIPIFQTHILQMAWNHQPDHIWYINIHKLY